jgi:hypothetical protein
MDEDVQDLLANKDDEENDNRNYFNFDDIGFDPTPPGNELEEEGLL